MTCRAVLSIVAYTGNATTTWSYTPAPVTVRPLEVTILAVLNTLGGLLTLVAGALAFGATAGSILAAFGLVPGVFMILLDLFQLFVAGGLWTGRRWAWVLALILGILGVISALLSLPTSIPSLFINGVIVYCLFTKPVKAFFGR